MQGIPATIGPELFAWLIECHVSRLTLYAAQFCDGPEDAVQEALVSLARQSSVPEKLLPWLYRSVRNAALDQSRQARRRQRRERSVAERCQGWFTAQPDGRLDAEAAAAALGSLPVDEREVVVAHLWGGLSFAEIAAMTGMSDSTAHRRYHEALELLRQKLGVTCLIANPAKR